MSTTIENPKISIGELSNIENLVIDNKAKTEDYERLDDYLFFLIGEKFLYKKLKENQIFDYSDFISRRNKKNIDNATNSSLSLLVGATIGIISVLKKHVLGKL